MLTGLSDWWSASVAQSSLMEDQTPTAIGTIHICLPFSLIFHTIFIDFDRVWVQDKYNNGMSKVFRVDFGDFRLVPHDQLFALGDSFWVTRPAAIPCHIFMPDTSSTKEAICATDFSPMFFFVIMSVVFFSDVRLEVDCKFVLQPIDTKLLVEEGRLDVFVVA